LVTLDTAGRFTLNVSVQTANGTITGGCPITVGPAVASKFVVVASTSTVSLFTPFNVTITAEDVFGNPTTNYPKGLASGFTVDLAASSGMPLSPTSVAFTQGETVAITPGAGTWPTTLKLTAFEITATGPQGQPFSNPFTGSSSQINVAPDWFSKNMPDLQLQELARAEAYNHALQLGYDDMLQLYTSAEQELLYWSAFEGYSEDNYNAVTSENNIMASLDALPDTQSPYYAKTSADLLYLANEVANPTANDLVFLACYYAGGNWWMPKVPTSSPHVPVYGGDYPFTLPQFGTAGGPQGTALESRLAALVNQWFLGTVYPNDAVPVDNVAPAPHTVPSRTLSLFGPSGLPEFTDVQQVGLGDCWVNSVFAAAAYRYPQAVKSMFTAYDNGSVYTIRFNNNGNWQYVTVDNALPGGGDEFNNPNVCDYSYDVMWAALLEKGIAELWGIEDGYNSLKLRGVGVWYSYNWLAGSQTSKQSSDVMDALNFPAKTKGNSADWSVNAGQVASRLNPTSGMPEGELECLSTPGSPKYPLDGGHSYAFLAFDSSTSNFLVYNPWGISAATTLTPGGITTTDKTDPIQVENAASIGIGDVLAIDSECMQVITAPTQDTTDSYYTLTVTRGLYDTPITQHGQHGANSEVYLNLGHAGTQINDLTPAWTQIENAPLSPFNGSTTDLGLFSLTEGFVGAHDWLNNGTNFKNENYTVGATPGSAGGAAPALVPRVKIPAVGAAAANAPSGSSSSREASPDRSKLVGMGPLTVPPPAHRRTLTTSQPSPHPVPSMVRLPARWARQDATVKPRRSLMAT